MPNSRTSKYFRALDDAAKEAERFLTRYQRWEKTRNVEYHGIEPDKKHAALQRSRLDLAQALGNARIEHWRYGEKNYEED